MKKNIAMPAAALCLFMAGAVQGQDIEMGAAQALVADARKAATVISQTREILKLTQAHLDAHRGELGLGPEDMPVIQDAKIIPSAHPALGAVGRVQLWPQTHGGLVVEDTEIHVVIDLKTKRTTASGKWYQSIQAPDRPKRTLEEARAGLIGTALTRQGCFGGAWRVVLTDANISKTGELVILPARDGSSFALAWKIRAGAWVVYADSQDGRLLRSIWG